MHNVSSSSSGAAQVDSSLPAPSGAGRERWMRSSRCAGNGCLEVAFGPGTVSVRDSKRADSPVLTYNHDEWRAFLAGVRQGEFDLADS